MTEDIIYFSIRWPNAIRDYHETQHYHNSHDAIVLACSFGSVITFARENFRINWLRSGAFIYGWIFSMGWSAAKQFFPTAARDLGLH